MKEWDWDGNKGIDPFTVGCHSSKKVSWMCPEHGAWIARVTDRCIPGRAVLNVARRITPEIP